MLSLELTWIRPNHRLDNVDRLDILAGTGKMLYIAKLVFVLKAQSIDLLLILKQITGVLNSAYSCRIMFPTLG